MKGLQAGALALVMALGVTGAGAETTAPAADAPDMLLESLRPMLPPAADGFDWALYRNVAYLRPAGWKSQTRAAVPEQRLVATYAQSPENFSEQKPFLHGFTIQVIPDFHKTARMPPAKGAISVIKGLTEARAESDVLLFDDGSSPIGKTFIFRYNDAPAGKTPIVVHKYFIADDKSDVLYIVTYESPKDSWEANWQQFGTPLLSRVAVIPFLPLDGN